MMELLPSVETVLQSIAAGLLVGCTYGLMYVALGLNRRHAPHRFAQGEFLMLGMYCLMSIVTIFGFGSLIGPVPAILVAVDAFPCVLRGRIDISIGNAGPERRRPEFNEGELFIRRS